jgi:putative component of toxin-antitoxin plasmid stabilization module
MYSVIETEAFTQWLSRLKDRTTRARLQVRLRKASQIHGSGAAK